MPQNFEGESNNNDRVTSCKVKELHLSEVASGFCAFGLSGGWINRLCFNLGNPTLIDKQVAESRERMMAATDHRQRNQVLVGQGVIAQQTPIRTLPCCTREPLIRRQE
jgi:hypothetical protein